MDDLSAWIGREEIQSDVATPGIYEKLAAVLDHETAPWQVGEAPPLGHWLNFTASVRQSGLGSDGHPRRGGFLPPVPLPRRMWAGGRLHFPGIIPLGSELERRSSILNVTAKSGRSGEMVFVVVRHEIWAAGRLAVVEEQDLVYRAAQVAAAATANEPALVGRSVAVAAPRSSDWERTVTPDPVLLFRYSALTYNSHRIHYDADYARSEEGYPGLVVHGPLIATLLIDHFLRRRPDARLKSFTFRAQNPLFDLSPFALHGVETTAGADLWAQGPASGPAMVASLEIER